MKLKGVIFDMDGVIVNSEPVHFRAETKILEGLDIHISKSGLSEFVGLAMDKFWITMKKRYSLSQTVEELLEYDTGIRVQAFAEYNDFESPAGARTLLERLKNADIPMALASSSHQALIDIVLDKMHYRGFFNYIVSGFTIKNGKPEPDIFLHAASKLGIKPDCVLVVEDSANGVLAAKRAGMKCLGFINPRSGRQDLSPSDVQTDDLSTITLSSIDKFFK